jgi:hypothetical protein
MGKRLTVVLAVVLALLAVSAGAYALEQESNGVVIDGAGTLAAHGRGHIEVDGAGWLRIRMSGDITITTGDDSIVRVRPLGQDTPDVTEGAATISLEDFVGIIVVRSSDFQVSAAGGFRHIFAKGDGVAFLQGRGWYRATGGYFGTWTKPGLRVQYSL